MYNYYLSYIFVLWQSSKILITAELTTTEIAWARAHTTYSYAIRSYQNIWNSPATAYTVTTN